MTVVFFEHNYRASRAEVLEVWVQGSSDFKIYGWNKRIDEIIEHGNNSTGKRCLKTHAIGRFAFISKSIFRNFGVKKSDVVVYTAVDDYFVAFCLLAPLIRLRYGRTQMRVVLYRSNFLFEKQGARDRVKKILWNFALASISTLKVGIFDERLILKSTSRYSQLYDPAPKVYFENVKIPQDLVSRSAIKLLYLGDVNERKGEKFLAEYLSLLSSALVINPIDVRVLFFGRFIPDSFLDRIKQSSSKSLNIIVRIGWASDHDWAEALDDSDVILLPYNEGHSATSGILARAVAKRVYVQATPHGLLGWRVKEYGLGGLVKLPEHLVEATYALAKAKESGLPLLRKDMNYEYFRNNSCVESSIKQFSLFLGKI
jgi:hypothetical protein